MVESYVPESSQEAIERAIAQLYAAGLELQSAGARRDIAPRRRAIISGEVERIAGLIDEIRSAADTPSRRSA